MMVETAVIMSLLCTIFYSGAMYHILQRGNIQAWERLVHSAGTRTTLVTDDCNRRFVTAARVMPRCRRCCCAALASSRLRTAVPARYALPANTTATRDWRPVPCVSFFVHVLRSADGCTKPDVVVLCFYPGPLICRSSRTVLTGQHDRVCKLPSWYAPRVLA